VRTTLLLAVAWTVIALAIVVLWPGGTNTPGCARLVEPSAACLTQLAAENDAAWRTSTVPMLLVIALGYAIVLLMGLRARRGRR
jgi:hypothetical protein